MRKLLTALAMASLSPISTADDVGVFAGVTYSFGEKGNFGVTAQLTTTRDDDKAFLGAGVSFFPFGDQLKIGLPIGVGYQHESIAGVLSYDLLLKSPAISVGYANTKSDNKEQNTTPAPAPAPAPPPP